MGDVAGMARLSRPDSLATRFLPFYFCQRVAKTRSDGGQLYVFAGSGNHRPDNTVDGDAIRRAAADD